MAIRERPITFYPELDVLDWYESLGPREGTPRINELIRLGLEVERNNAAHMLTFEERLRRIEKAVEILINQPLLNSPDATYRTKSWPDIFGTCKSQLTSGAFGGSGVPDAPAVSNEPTSELYRALVDSIECSSPSKPGNYRITVEGPEADDFINRIRAQAKKKVQELHDDP